MPIYETIQDFLKTNNYLQDEHVLGVLFYGSYKHGLNNQNSDIDIAVRGLNEKDFYRVASILMFELENEIDLIDLDDKENRFSQMLLKVGGLLKVG